MKLKNNKELLQDILARIPYVLMCKFDYTFNNETTYGEDVWTTEDCVLRGMHAYSDDCDDYLVWFDDDEYFIDDIKIKPYLRSLSKMTEEERKESREWLMLSCDRDGNRYFDGFCNVSSDIILKGINWLYAHHFDYRGFIEKGWALEAPDNMYVELLK